MLTARTTHVARAALCALVWAWVAGASVGGQNRDDLVPVGIRYQPAADPAARQRDLENIRRFRFNVVVLPQQTAQDTELTLVDRLLAGAPDTRFRMSAIEELTIGPTESERSVTVKAWRSLAGGARGVIFGDWRALAQNSDALAAATAFADHITRNSGLYSALRRGAPGTGLADPTVQGNDPAITASFLESPSALLLIVTNQDPSKPHDVTLTFAPDTPEAIWQNMLTGANVNFVAGPAGPTYSRTIEGEGVVVLMIGKRVR